MVSPRLSRAAVALTGYYRAFIALNYRLTVPAANRRAAIQLELTA
jgi:hypothetical protein